MSKIFSKMSLGLLVAMSVAWSAGAAVPVLKTLSGHVPNVATQISSTGRLASTNRLHLAIGLPVHNQEGINALLAQINDPASPHYHQYLTPEQFTALFGPTEQEYQSVIDYAQSSGLTVSARHSNRMLVEVDAPVTNVERAFNINLRTYKHPSESRQFFAPDKEPSVPANLSVLDIGGLSDYARPHPRLHFPSAKEKAVTPKLGSGAGGTYRGNDFRAAYVPGTTLTGAGQKVALVQFDGYFASDISGYEQLSGLPSVSLTNILLQGFSGFPQTGGQIEVTLDIEMVIAMAPGVSQVLVYEGDPFNFNQVIVLNRIATDNAARVVSCSWGWTGGPGGTVDQIFQQMILQGQTFFDASGDVDAFLPPGTTGSVDDPNSFNAPSDDPYITQVGGTTLTTTGPGGTLVSEKVWNPGLIDTNQDGSGSSGGISGFYPIPSWQSGVNMVTNHGSATFRNLPDVAMTGDNVDVYVDGIEIPVGGTSCAAPLWAGFIALANQQAALNGRQPVGFLNPALYTLGKSNNTAFYNDVTTGNNTWSQSPINFPAVPGFDLTTGWGSPLGMNFINALTAASLPVGSTNTPVNSIISAPQISPNWNTNLSVMNGTSPNGDWFLFVQDDKQQDSGMINNGWMVTLTTATPVGFPADIALYASLTNVVVAPGTNFSVTLAVTNYGPATSTNVVVQDTLPGTGVTLISSNFTAGSVSRAGDTLNWNLSNLVVNAGATLTLTFKANTVGSYVNTPAAGASLTTPDLNPDDEMAATIITVGVPTPPTLTGTVSIGSGNHFTFHVDDSFGPTSVIIQASTNLLTWVPIYTNTTPFDFTDLNATNYPDRFYRAITGP